MFSNRLPVELVFARHAVLNRDVRGRLVSRQGLRHELLDGCRSGHAELHTRGYRGIAAGKDAPEAVPIEESIASGGRRNNQRGELSPEAMIRSPHDQLGQSKQRLAEKAAANPCRNLIVFRWSRGFPGNLPKCAPERRVSHRRPEVEPG